MSGIRARDTKPELLVRKFLHAEGLRYRLNVRTLPGSPDLVLPRWKTVVFVHGCFWHRHPGCGLAYTPKSRQAFWSEKFEHNVARDASAIASLEAAGWKVIVVWECTLRKSDHLAVLVELAQQIREGWNDEGRDGRSV
jgi:DNA mismatch endonuclease (patch repair protein)